MSHRAWDIRDHTARLQHQGLVATLDLDQPARGLVAIAAAFGPVAEARVLGIEVPSAVSAATGLLAEWCLRGDDLAATYPETAEWPVQLDCVWRAGAWSGSRHLARHLDLILSVRTQLLQGRPEVAIHSFLAAEEVWRAADDQAMQFEPCPISPSSPVVLGSGVQAGCVVFRLPGSRQSYAEMIHPADFRVGELHSDSPGIAAGVHLRQRLFTTGLEKGVMLRARVRGVWLPANGDLALAGECYRDLAAAEPPLEV